MSGLVSLLRKKCNFSFFTTPSHSQKFFIFNKFRNFYKYDISETDFHNPEEALAFGEAFAAKVYGTRVTKFLINGSTSGILAAVLACVKKGDKVLIWNNAHICHKNAVDIAGGIPVYYELPKDEVFGVYQKTTVDIIEPILEAHNIKALIVTSPTYEGFVSDIKSIKSVCEKYGTYLIVDEAHGALYPFSDRLPESAVKIADFTIQSLHKTAGGLNPTALFHTNTDLDVEGALAKITTTSPSYPLLASIEANIKYLNSSKGRKKIDDLLNIISDLKINCTGCIFGGDDISKILVKVEAMTGYTLSETLFNKYKIEDERTNEKSSLLICGLGTDKLKLKRLEKAFIRISKG